MEQWKLINNYNNYSVSNFGYVRNDKSGRILKPIDNGDGYLFINLSKNGIRKNFTIHRLVGLHFLPNWKAYKEIDHRNQDKLDNRVLNLRWATRSEQCANKTKQQNTTSKFIGVSFHKIKNKWVAHIRCQKLLGGKRKYLGYFETEDEANSSRQKYIIDNHLEDFYSQKI